MDSAGTAPDPLVAPLLTALATARPEADVARIEAAFELAHRAHATQRRKSGEPYIVHPVAVATILAELRMDDDTIVAALLHDVLEDCPEVTATELKSRFGDEVVRLVDGVTKLSLGPQGGPVSATTKQTETLRKMLLATAKDPRVMLIKLADRLHNMETLGAMPDEKRTRIANETLEIYAPIAARLGIWQIKWKLEDLAFKTLHPAEFQKVRELVGATRAERERVLDAAIAAIREGCESRGVRVVEIRGRPKHLYSIYNKMVKHGFQFEEILDLIALRILVERVEDCYMALGAVHENYTPLPQYFGDYIGAPKPNGYRSLHTKVLGPHGRPIEVQIRTREMHDQAEFGIAAHFAYKEKGEGARAGDGDQLGRLRQMLEQWSTDAPSAEAYRRTMDTDFFADQVFVHTPKGDVIELPAGATVIDFAFRVHTKLGLTLIGARVNGTQAPLATVLKNGDAVELITRSNATPSRDWIKYAKSAHTRSKLNAYFRKLTKDEDALKGRTMLERELRNLRLDPKPMLTDERLRAVAQQMGFDAPMDVLAKVGNGLAKVEGVLNRLRGLAAEPKPVYDKIEIRKTPEGKTSLSIAGATNILVVRAKCCDPIPGDDVLGYVTRARGVMIHRRVCPNAQAFLLSEPERLMNYEWPASGDVYPVNVRAIAMDRAGLLMEIGAIFATAKMSVNSSKSFARQDHTAQVDVNVSVADQEQLQTIFNRISSMPDVISVERVVGKGARG